MNEITREHGMSEAGNSLQRQLGRLLWRAGLKSRLSADERRASWIEGRRDCMVQAGRMLRLMEEEGIVIALAEPRVRGRDGMEE